MAIWVSIGRGGYYQEIPVCSDGVEFCAGGGCRWHESRLLCALQQNIVPKYLKRLIVPYDACRIEVLPEAV
jgi:hypothetical protein